MGFHYREMDEEAGGNSAVRGCRRTRVKIIKKKKKKIRIGDRETEAK